MKRFQELLIAATPDRKPWETLPSAAIDAVAVQCGPGDVTDIVAALEELAVEKSSLPTWDGDSQDDINKTQMLFASILDALPATLAPVLSQALSATDEETRKWVELARSEKP